ncbi:MAG: hypothetical protein ACK4VN_00110 [Bacteroidales bacterium]
MIHLMFHDDWEIYGDGSGDPEKLMFEPAKRLLDICDTFGAKYTFYAEIGQQLNMLDAPAEKWKKHAKTWETILQDAVKRGHDVQLHFHPQWIGAKLVDGESWSLDYSKWNTGKLPFDILDEWIAQGVKYLRSLFTQINPDYDVLSYRAGGWMCQPSTLLYKALKKHGIVCDVSVIKGRYRIFEDGGCIDFRLAHSRFNPWEVDPNNFAFHKEGSGFWELPVYSETSRLPHPLYLLSRSLAPLHYFKIFRKRKQQKGSGYYSPKSLNSTTEKDYYGSFGYMHYKHLLAIVQSIKGNMDLGNKEKHLIFLTHSKSFLDFRNFEKLLRELVADPNIKFSTTQNYINKFILP